jgi:hypothetical protein
MRSAVGGGMRARYHPRSPNLRNYGSRKRETEDRERMRLRRMGKKMGPGLIWFMWFNHTTNATQAGRGKIVYSIKFLSP